LPLCYTSTSTPGVCPLSLHDALPISKGSSSTTRQSCSAASCSNLCALGRLIEPPVGLCASDWVKNTRGRWVRSSACSTSMSGPRSEEHTSELQSREKLVCRLLLEKKK